MFYYNPKKKKECKASSSHKFKKVIFLILLYTEYSSHFIFCFSELYRFQILQMIKVFEF